VNGDDILEFLAAIDLADALDGAELVGVWRARIVEERFLVEPRRFDDQRVAVPMAGGVAPNKREKFSSSSGDAQRLGHRHQADARG